MSFSLTKRLIVNNLIRFLDNKEVHRLFPVLCDGTMRLSRSRRSDVTVVVLALGLVARQSNGFCVSRGCCHERCGGSIRRYSVSKRKKKSTQQEEAAQTKHDATATEQASAFTTSYHAPVMVKECITALLDCQCSKADGGQHQPLVFVDCTLGGGGHSQALLEALKPGDVVFGCDVDSDALKIANKRLSKFSNNTSTDLPLFVPVLSNFCDLNSKMLTDRLTEKCGDDNTQYSVVADSKNGLLVDGILMDLGVSSHQIDSAKEQ